MTYPAAISENEYKNFNSYLENVVMKKECHGDLSSFSTNNDKIFCQVRLKFRVYI